MEQKKKTILIVEDELPVLNLLKEQFSAAGFEVIEAKNGVEGYDLVTKKLPDLILLDIIMPKLDGIHMLKKMREVEKCKDIPVVILTNLSSSKAIAEAAASAAYEYLIKTDWKLEDVVKKVKEKLGIV